MTENLYGPEILFSARNLSKYFPAPDGAEPFRALDGVNLDIYRGECLLIAGANGSGKSLLVKLLAGLQEPSGGEVLYRGAPLAAARRFRAEVGVVFQDADAQIVGETVIEDAVFGPRNLGLPKDAALAAAKDALGKTGLPDKMDANARKLSGGEKRRLAVAGVIAAGARCVFFDEPFANLDWPGVKSVVEIIKNLKNAGCTLVVLTHELEKILALADRLAIMHRGRVRGLGLPEDVLARLRPEYGVRNPLRGGVTVKDCLWAGEEGGNCGAG